MDWLERAESYYKKSVPTMKRWFAEIVGYFENRTTVNVADVFIAGDLLWYPVEGNNTLVVAPDVMIVFGRGS